MISAEEFSKAGSKYLGRPYDRKQPGGMDCQDFYEQCLKDCGLSMDLGGSNAWYRKIRSTGWTGSPEECKAKFGSIPKGATLFIHAFDGGEEKRGYHDGLGNASHIGIKTGTGKGAIHSSASRGCVAESEFHDKTIRGGGWNMVGLSTLFDYGDKINRILNGGADPEPDPEPPWDDDPGGDEVKTPEKAVVDVPNGTTVNMRSKASTSSALVERVPHGEEVTVLKKEKDWSRCSWKKWTGWIMNVYLVFEPEEDDDPIGGDDFPDYPDDDDVEPGELITIRINAEDAVKLLTVMDLIEDQIAKQIGRG